MDILLKKTSKPIKKSAIEVFTDRVEPRTAFNEALDAVFTEMQKMRPTTHILNFYGFGGIGKTTLIDKLREELRERNKREKQEIKFIDIKLDANKNSRSTPNEIIAKIVDEISNKYSINNFPRTMWAKYVFYTKSGDKPDMQFDNKNKNLVERGVNIALELGKCFAPFGAFIELGKGLFENIKTDKDLSFDQVKKIFLKAMKEDADGQKEIEYIEEYTTQDIEKMLPQWFYEDLSSITIAEGPFVFFFDTFEYLTDDISNIDIISKPTEKFLQEVICNVPFSIWVIAGREKLVKNENGTWGKIDNVEDHFLDKLDKKDLEYYFQYAQIDMSMLDTFMQLSEGIPSIVDFLYDRYIKLYDQHSTEPILPHLNPQNYGATKEEFVQDFIDRNIRYFKNSSSRSLFYTLLSIDAGWTDEDIAWLKPHLKCYNDETYNTIKNLSIIRRTGNTYAFHNEARKFLLAQVPPEINEETEKLLLKYHKEKINASSLNENTEDIKQLASLNLQEAAEIFINTVFTKVMNLIDTWRLTDAKEILDSYNEAYNNTDNYEFKYLHASAYYELYTKMGHFLDSYRQAVECQNAAAFLSNVRYRLNADFMLACSYFNRGIYNTACELHKKCYEARLREFGEKDKDTLESKKFVGKCLSKKGDRLEGLRFHEEAFKISIELYGEESKETQQALTEIARDLIDHGKYKEAIDKLDEAYRSLKEQNKNQETPDTLTILLDIKTCLQAMNNLEKAELIARYCVEEFCKQGRDFDYQAIIAKLELGYTCFNLNKMTEAITLFEEVHDFGAKTLGEDSLLAIKALRGIALCYGCYLEKENEGLEILNKCYKFLKNNEALGEDHREAILILEGIACNLYLQGRKEEALPQFQKLLNLGIKVFGESSPLVTKTYFLIGDCFYCMGDYLKALREFQKSYKGRKIVSGDRNRDTIYSLAYMGESLRNLGRHDEALECYKECYDLAINVLGESNESTLYFLYWMAQCYIALNNWNEAVENLNLCYELKAQVLGETNEDTLNTLQWKAICLKKLCRYNEALEASKHCYKLRVQTLGETNEYTLTALYLLAECLMRLEKYDEALECFSKCYELRSKTLGAHNINTLDALFWQAVCLGRKERIAEALEKHKQCYELRAKTLGTSNEDTLNSLYCMAHCLKDTGKNNEAFDCFKLCYELLAQTLGEYNKETIDTLLQVSLCLLDLDRYEEAYVNLKKCYRNYILTLEEDDIKIIQVLDRMAICLSNLGKNNEALECYSKCYNLQLQKSGDKDEETLSYLNEVAYCLFCLERYDDALSKFTECYQLQSQIYEEDNEKLLWTIYQLANCLLQMGRFAEAIKTIFTCYERTKDSPFWSYQEIADFLDIMEAVQSLI